MSNVYNIIQALVRTFFRTGQTVQVSKKVSSLVFAEWSDLHVLGMLGLLQQLETLDEEAARIAALFLRDFLTSGKKATPEQLEDAFFGNKNPLLECVINTLYEIFVEGIYTPLDEEYLKHFKPFGNYLGPGDTQDVLTTSIILNDGSFGWSGAVPKAHGVGKTSDNLTIWSKGSQLKSPKYGWGFEEKDSTLFLVEKSSGMRIELGDEDVLKAYKEIKYPAILDLTRGQGLPQNYYEVWCHLHKHAPDLVKKTSMVDLCVIIDGLRSIVKDKYLSIPTKNSLFESLNGFPISFDTFQDQHLVPDHIASILEAMTDDTWQGPDECYRILDACGISRDRTKHDLTFQSQTIMSEVFRNLEVLRLNDVRQPDLDGVWLKTIVDSVVNVEKTIEAARKEEEDIVFKEPEELNIGAREPSPKKGRKAPVPIKHIDWGGDLEKEDSKTREEAPQSVVSDTVFSYYRKYENTDVEKELETCPPHLRKEVLGWALTGLDPTWSKFEHRVVSAISLVDCTEESLELAWKAKDLELCDHDFNNRQEVVRLSGKIVETLKHSKHCVSTVNNEFYFLNTLLWHYPPEVLAEIEALLPEISDSPAGPVQHLLRLLLADPLPKTSGVFQDLYDWSMKDLSEKKIRYLKNQQTKELPL